LARVLPSLAERGIDVRLAARHVVEPRAFGIRAATIAWAKDDAPSDARAARIVAETIADWRPDAVMTSNVHDAAVLQAARTARRLIVRVHDHRLFCPQGNRQYPHFPTLCTKPMSAGTCVANALLRGCGPGLSARTVRLVRARETLRKIVVQADHVVVSSRFMAAASSSPDGSFEIKGSLHSSARSRESLRNAVRSWPPPGPPPRNRRTYRHLPHVSASNSPC
jgi:hypothetical protein